MKFKEIKAKECPNIECQQIIPETWEGAFEVDWCPKCGYGFDEEKMKNWRKKRGYE